MARMLVALTALWATTVAWGAEDPFLHTTNLDPYGRFVLHWYYDQQSVVFKMEVATTGYVGFGISPHGGMAGSDIVIGWVKNGHVFIQDRHATGNAMPEVDRIQDWKLVRGQENGTHTVLELRRKINTCDPEDFPISIKDTVRAIYAYHPEDPSSLSSLRYHDAERRGSKSLLILQPRVWKDMPSDALIWDATHINFAVPPVDTFYQCRMVKFPRAQTKHHVIKIEPLIQPGMELNVHHIALYQCDATESELEAFYQTDTGYQCYAPGRPDMFKVCNGLFTVWAIGGETLVLPDNAGLPLGETDTTYFLLEVHYDNPTSKDGMVDSSGLRVIYTPKLRKYDAGTLMVGADLFPTVMIPPGQSRFIVPGHCAPECLAPVMDPKGIKVRGYYLHAHLMARKLRLRHFRNGTELEPLANDKNYDFAYQEYHYFTEEKVILPGDHLTLECYYDSKDRQMTTLNGLSSMDEMCVTGLFYYPRMPRVWCISHPLQSTLMGLTGVEKLSMDHLDLDQPQKYTIEKPDELKGVHFLQHLVTYPIDSEFVNVVQGATRYGPHKQLCQYVGGQSFEMPSAVTYPQVTHRIREKNLCNVAFPEDEEDAMGGIWTFPNAWD